MEITEKIKIALKEAIVKLGQDVSLEEITLTKSDIREHGDYACNIALRKAKLFKMNPLTLAESIRDNVSSSDVEKIDAVKPGFINIFVKQDALGTIIKDIVSSPSTFGCSDIGKGKRVNIEYVSANPTGTLHLGHARGAAIGDCLSRLYKKSGYEVIREYYVNDAGVQMDHLAESILARYLQLFGIEREVPEDGYHGPEIIEIAKELKEEIGDTYLNSPESHLSDFKKYGGEKLLDAIKRDLHEFRVDQDVYTSEKAIRERGDVEVVLERLKPYCYFKDGALWLNTTKDGDDKDRVLVKSDGNYTYLLPDIAYHNDKFRRGCDLMIDIFGADHHGYIARLKSSQKDLGNDYDALRVCLVQMVRLFKDGQEFKMSKRTGNAITMKELVEEVGVDAVRYFFVSRSASSHLDFDIDIAKSMGSENPVYYAQYTHARLCGILRNASSFYPLEYTSSFLSNDAEKDLMIILKSFSDVIKNATIENEPYKITNYIQQLSTSINAFYSKCRVIDNSNEPLTKERLGLVEACRDVLKEALELIGVTPVETMSSQEEK